jgi:Uma2 family endonuclease
MADTALRLATYEDLCALPETMVGEIIHGVLHAMPISWPRQTLAYSRLLAVLGRACEPGSGASRAPDWWLLGRPELHIGPNVLVPDLAGWRVERMPKLPDTAWFETAPDWVCEALSPSTMSHDRVTKAEIYREAGVPHLWLLDPDARTLEAYNAREGLWARIAAIAGDSEVRILPFDAIGFPLSRLWAD